MYGGNYSEYKYTWKQNNKTINKTDSKYDTSAKDSTYAVNVYGKTIRIPSISFGLIIRDVDEDDLEAEYNINVINDSGNVTTCRVKLERKSMHIVLLLDIIFITNHLLFLLYFL